MDFIEIVLNNGSYIMTGIMIGLGAYWSCLSYGAATMIQVFEYSILIISSHYTFTFISSLDLWLSK